MKILFAPSHYAYDGIKRGSEVAWAYNIVHRIASIYPESTVVTGFKESKRETQYKVIEVQKNKKYIDLSIMNSLCFNFLYTREIFRNINSVDIVHHVLPFGIDNTFNFAFIFRKRDKKYIIGPIQKPIKSFSDNIHDQDQKPLSPIIRLIENIITVVFNPLVKKLSLITLQQADKIIVIDKSTKNLLVKKGVSEKKIVIIPPGIDTNVYKPKEPVHKDFTLISSSMLIKRKKIDQILKSISIAVKTIPNIKLIIVGDGPEKENLKKYASELKLEGNIVFKGLVSNHQMSQEYSRADIFLNMSESESWGQVFFEASAGGLALISTDVGAAKLIINHGRNGFIVKNHKQMAAYVIKLYKNKRLLRSMKNMSRRITVENYDWNKSTSTYNTVYTDVFQNDY